MAISPGPGMTGGSISGVGTAWPMTRRARSEKMTRGCPLNVHAIDDRLVKTIAV
jgi:hypothetical protein